MDFFNETDVYNDDFNTTDWVNATVDEFDDGFVELSTQNLNNEKETIVVEPDLFYTSQIQNSSLQLISEDGPTSLINVTTNQDKIIANVTTHVKTAPDLFSVANVSDSNLTPPGNNSVLLLSKDDILSLVNQDKTVVNVTDHNAAANQSDTSYHDDERTFLREKPQTVPDKLNEIEPTFKRPVAQDEKKSNNVNQTETGPIFVPPEMRNVTLKINPKEEVPEEPNVLLNINKLMDTSSELLNQLNSTEVNSFSKLNSQEAGINNHGETSIPFSAKNESKLDTIKDNQVIETHPNLLVPEKLMEKPSILHHSMNRTQTIPNTLTPSNPIDMVSSTADIAPNATVLIEKEREQGLIKDASDERVFVKPIATVMTDNSSRTNQDLNNTMVAKNHNILLVPEKLVEATNVTSQNPINGTETIQSSDVTTLDDSTDVILNKNVSSIPEKLNVTREELNVQTSPIVSNATLEKVETQIVNSTSPEDTEPLKVCGDKVCLKAAEELNKGLNDHSCSSIEQYICSDFNEAMIPPDESSWGFAEQVRICKPFLIIFKNIIPTAETKRSPGFGYQHHGNDPCIFGVLDSIKTSSACV